MRDPYLEFYSRREIQERILEVAEDREVAPRYNQGFGRRPDVIQFPADILEMAKKGATSFHISEERWHNPLQLKPGMQKRDLDENRKGWDLVLDIDTKFWDYAKWTAFYLVEALKFHDVKNIAVKFSGNKGFHIAVPFESFPDEVNGRKTKYLFPEGLRVMAAYLQNMITDMLRNKILETEDIDSLVSKTDLQKTDLVKDGKLDPFVIIDIDTILISNRHLFRAPYSLHEKSGLVSIPINNNDVLTFEKEHASPKNVKGDLSFLDMSLSDDNDAKTLIIQAFDWWGKKNAKRGPDVETVERTFDLPKNAIPKTNFPNCIEKILEGGMEDGKKRAIFILINFLRHMGWKWPEIESTIKEWNKKNPNPLGESYVIGQLSWHRRQKESILPPNCSNKAYYQDLRIKCGGNTCTKFKNPVRLAQWKNKIAEEQAKKKSKKVKKKVKKKKKVSNNQ